MGISAAKRQTWINHIAAWAAGGQTQCEYCAPHGWSSLRLKRV